MHESSSCSVPVANLWYCYLVFLTLLILVGVKWFHFVVLICISLLTNDSEIFLSANFFSVYSSACLNLLPHFENWVVYLIYCKKENFAY